MPTDTPTDSNEIVEAVFGIPKQTDPVEYQQRVMDMVCDYADA